MRGIVLPGLSDRRLRIGEVMEVTILEILHNISAVLLSLVGLNALVLSIIYLVTARKERPRPPVPSQWPEVVVQLPIYNERHVVERLIAAVGKLDYPPNKLFIQVLDDSTDETVSIAAKTVEKARQAGLSIEHVRRSSRTGFKAGALAYGFEHSTAQFVAVFDADFVPDPDFLTRVIPYLVADDRLGMAQTRWAHLNAEHSLLTRAQALGLDNHFVIEQTARDRGGLFMNFSGTGGVWRRDCIIDSGGWHSDTLSEDIDLSYRAQLRGWKLTYLPDIGTPSEITPLMMGFKQQQARWATGTIQCLRKMGKIVLTSPHVSVWQKLQAMIHLSAYFVHPLMIVLLLTSLPLIIDGRLSQVPLAGLSVAMFGPPLASLLAQTRLYRDWPQRLLFFPVAMLVGIGIAVSNTEAVFKGLRSGRQPFLRTPKFHLQGKQGKWANGGYSVPVDYSTAVEMLLALYSGLTAYVAWLHHPSIFPFMVLYTIGFAYTAGLSIWQAGVTRWFVLRDRRLELSRNS
jgi:cellulose synthase/poly-beta-1,6-N-acetylglucosamine synthase-like glycosyltransferase